MSTDSTSRRTRPSSGDSSPWSWASPRLEETVAILRGLKERYEVHHGVRITDPALDRRGLACPIATSAIASFRTKPSTLSTKRRHACESRSTRCPRRSTSWIDASPNSRSSARRSRRSRTRSEAAIPPLEELERGPRRGPGVARGAQRELDDARRTAIENGPEDSSGEIEELGLAAQQATSDSADLQRSAEIIVRRAAGAYRADARSPAEGKLARRAPVRRGRS